jgi:hypothetical protein
MTGVSGLRTYDDWKHCITILCGIRLTSTYVEQRLAALRDPKVFDTQPFVATWGAAHLEWCWFGSRGCTKS